VFSFGGIMKAYKVDEVAEQLNVSIKTIRRYIYSGKIAANKIGGQWRISQENIDQYLESISNQSLCCDASPSTDDFCIFMDTDYFSSEDALQLCTIIDFYSNDLDEIASMSTILQKVVTEDGIHDGKAQYNYIFDKPLNRARFVLWGSATFIEKAAKLTKNFERSESDAKNL
jgi:excisionase family DNA binding protein